VPDCLSRCIPIEQRINQHNIPLHEIVPAAEIMSVESKDLREILAEAQVEDKELQIIRQQISEDPDLSHRYSLISDVLFYFDGTRNRLVVPESFIPRVLQALHGSIYSGHLGAEKTRQ
jgi:DNA-directed RNA polymerase subunit H (RpoH/RPB5)